MAWPIQDYLDERSLELSPRTIASYRWALRDAERRIHVGISELTPLHLLALSSSWRRNDQLLSHLRNFLRWAGHPLAKRVPQGIPPETRRQLIWYTIAELEAVVEACRTPRERLLVHLACELMLRRIEIERLTWTDLEETNIRVLGKGRHGGKVRRIPYHPYSRRLLSDLSSSSSSSRWNSNSGSTMPIAENPGRTVSKSTSSTDSGTSTGSSSAPRTKRSSSTLPTSRSSSGGERPGLLGLRRSALDKELKRIGARVPMNLQFHALRRTGGRLFVQAGTQIGKGALEVLNELRGIYGHEDLRTTMRYIGWELENAGTTMAQMPRLERRRDPADVPAPKAYGPSGMTNHKARK